MAGDCNNTLICHENFMKILQTPIEEENDTTFYIQIAAPLNSDQGESLITCSSSELLYEKDELIQAPYDSDNAKTSTPSLTLDKYMKKLLRMDEEDLFDKEQKTKSTLKAQTETKTANFTEQSVTDIVISGLADLMHLENIGSYLSNKSVVLKLSFKYPTKQTAFIVRGRIQNNKDGWKFVECQMENCVYQEDMSWADKLNDDNVYLTFLVSIDAGGKIVTTARVRPICSASLNNKRELCIQLHNTLFGCSKCPQIFVTKRLLFEHKKLHMIERRCIACTICNQKFYSTGSLKRHLATHSPLKRCTVCMRHFTNTFCLEKHMAIHKHDGRLSCKICGTSFVSKGDLKSHRRTHVSGKFFICKVCGQKFSRQSNLYRHIQIHKSEDALYKCYVCGCSYAFSSSLTRHFVQMHLGKSCISRVPF